MYGSIPDVKDRPSLKFSKELTDDDRLHKEMLVLCAENLDAYIQTQNLLVTLKLMLNSLLVMENMHVVAVLQTMRAIYVILSIVRRQLTCTSPLETMYFSSKIGFMLFVVSVEVHPRHHWWTMTRQRH